MRSLKTPKRLNFVINVFLLVAVVALVGQFAYRITSRRSNSYDVKLKAGDTFQGMQQINFAKSENCILIALDTKCVYCNLSKDFYRKLLSLVGHAPATRVVALFDENQSEVETYLRENQLDVEFIANAELVKATIDITPSLIVIDSNRLIRASYEGMLREKQENDLLTMLEGGVLHGK